MATTIKDLPDSLVIPSDEDVFVLDDVSELETKKIAFADLRDAILAAVAGGGDAASITYDPTASGLTATDVQAALDELAEGVDAPIIVEPSDSFPVNESYNRAIVRCTTATNGFAFVPEGDPGRSVRLVQEGTGQITFDPDSTTLLYDSTTFNAKTAAQGSSVVLFWLTSTLVLVVGDLERAVPIAADAVSYDPGTSALTATDVQGAIEELTDGQSIPLTTGEAIGALVMVAIDSSGIAWIADPAFPARTTIGMSLAAAGSAATVRVRTSGVVGGLSGLTAAAPYFLASAGAISTDTPVMSGSFVQQIGIALSATTLLLDVEERILIS